MENRNPSDRDADAKDLAAYRAGYQPLYGNPHSKNPTAVVPREGADIRSADRALRRLHDRHRTPVFAVVFRRFSNASLDEQVVEECLLDALHRRSFVYDPDRAGFGTWLSTITGNAVADALRAGDREGTRESDAVSPGDDLDLRDLVERVLATLEGDAARDIAARRILAPALGQRPVPRREIEDAHGLTPKRVRVLEAHTRSLLAAGAKSAVSRV